MDVDACVMCLRDVWSDLGTKTYRKPATGLLLHHFIRERSEDYAIKLRTGFITILRDMKAQATPEAVHAFPGEVPGQPIQCVKKFWEEVRLPASHFVLP